MKRLPVAGAASLSVTVKMLVEIKPCARPGLNSSKENPSVSGDSISESSTRFTVKLKLVAPATAFAMITPEAAAGVVE